MISTKILNNALKPRLPVRLGTLTEANGAVREFLHLWHVLDRMEQYAPMTFRQYKQRGFLTLASPVWQAPLLDLYAAIDGVYFEVDWPAYEEASQDYPCFVEHLPVTLYGFGEEDFDTHPFLALARALWHGDDAAWLELENQVWFGSQFKALLTRHVQSRAVAIWDRLHQIETEPLAWPEPLRWLPALVRYSAGATNNALLNRTHHVPLYHLEDTFVWTWSDLDLVRGWWVEAKPVVEAAGQLTAWCRDDNSFIALARFLITGQDAAEIKQLFADWPQIAQEEETLNGF